MSACLKPALLSFCLFLFMAHGFCSPDDSITAKPKKLSSQNDTWFLMSEPEKHYVIDSTIFHLEDYNVIEREGREYENLGNTGTAAFPLIFDADRTMGFNPGYNQFDLYRYTKDSIRYYQVIRPYVEVSMTIGLNYEQLFKVRIANNYKKLIYYGLDFTRLFSKGIYQNQRANDNGFSLYGLYNSKNGHWNVRADMIFNLFKVQENGGVTLDPFDSSYFKKNLVSVLMDSAENQYTEINFFLTSTYNVGKSYYQRKNDTLVVKSILPVFRVSHQLNIERNIFKFRNYSPDSILPVGLLPAQAKDGLLNERFYQPDSVYNTLNYFKVGNELQLEYHPRTLTSDSTYVEKDFVAFAEAGFDYFLLNQNSVQHNFGDLYVGGTFRNNYASKPKIIYRASAKYFIAGYNQNDLLVDGDAGYDFGKFGTLTGNATYMLKEAPYIFEHYDYPSATWNYKLPKTKVLNIGGKYENPKYGLTADFNYYVADHIPVLPGSPFPYVTSSEENAFVIHAGNRNGVAGVHFDNDIWYTIAPNAGYISSSFPMLYTRHSIYYERRVFKNLLWFSTGFDLRIRYHNNAPYYDPLFGAFVPTGVNLPTYPVLDFFLNFKIKTVRIFLKVTNISSEFGPVGYFAAYAYPANDISFIAGVSWRFFD